ncbi:MAG: hypothetical protein V2A62_03730 [Candidatus Woesearchaeota archaeon]
MAKKMITGGWLRKSSPLEKAAEQVQAMHQRLEEFGYSPLEAYQYGMVFVDDPKNTEGLGCKRILTYYPDELKWFEGLGRENNTAVKDFILTLKEMHPQDEEGIYIGLFRRRYYWLMARPYLAFEYSPGTVHGNHYRNPKIIVTPAKDRSALFTHREFWGYHNPNAHSILIRQKIAYEDLCREDYKCDRLRAWLDFTNDEELRFLINTETTSEYDRRPDLFDP